jgi:hypothetical protein
VKYTFGLAEFAEEKAAFFRLTEGNRTDTANATLKVKVSFA